MIMKKKKKKNSRNGCETLMGGEGHFIGDFWTAFMVGRKEKGLKREDN